MGESIFTAKNIILAVIFGVISVLIATSAYGFVSRQWNDYALHRKEPGIYDMDGKRLNGKAAYHYVEANLNLSDFRYEDSAGEVVLTRDNVGDLKGKDRWLFEYTWDGNIESYYLLLKGEVIP